MDFDRCPICHQSFAECDHSLVHVNEWIEKRKLDKTIRKICQNEIRGFLTSHGINLDRLVAITRTVPKTPPRGRKVARNGS